MTENNFKNIHLLSHLKRRTRDRWLVNYDNQSFYLLTQKLYFQLTQFSNKNISQKLILIDSDPWLFSAGFIAGVAANCQLFLCNANWQEGEWQQVLTLVKPDLIWGASDLPDSAFGERHLTSISDKFTPNSSRELTNDRGSSLIMIPTGGSSGEVRFAIHTWETLSASVLGCYRYFGEKAINSFCLLPLCHVSGLMQFLRSFLTGGNFLFLPYKQFKERPKTSLDVKDFFISLVPTQLQFLLKSNPDWLSQFRTVLLGGAPAWKSLICEAKKHRINLALTYGMTETASQIVTLKPEEFQRGNDSVGRVLPHAEVNIIGDRDNLLEPNTIGAIAIKAKSLFLGYYPEFFSQNTCFKTDDLGYFDSEGYLYIVGRNSRKIITGGENVFPAEVESVILATQLVEEVSIIGMPDRQWGEAVTAVYIAKDKSIASETIELAIADKISKFKQPKYWVAVESLPRNLQGKINERQLRAIVEEKLSHNPAIDSAIASYSIVLRSRSNSSK